MHLLFDNNIVQLKQLCILKHVPIYTYIQYHYNTDKQRYHQSDWDLENAILEKTS